MATEQIDPRSVDWSLLKPALDTTTLLQTVGPSTHPGRESSCIICLADIDETEQTVTHSECLHTSHRSCSDEWLKQRTLLDVPAACPMCQQPYVIRDIVQSYCEQKIESVVTSVAGTFALGAVERGITREDIIQIFQTAHKAIWQGQYSFGRAMPRENEIIRDINLTDYRNTIRLNSLSVEHTIQDRTRVIIGEAEDMIIAGKPWTEVKKEIDNKWARLMSRMAFELVDLRDEAKNCTTDILEHIQTYARQTVGLPALFKKIDKTNMQEAIDRRVWILKQRTAPVINGFRDAVLFDFDLHAKKCYADYRERTGTWTLPASVTFFHYPISYDFGTFRPEFVEVEMPAEREEFD